MTVRPIHAVAPGLGAAADSGNADGDADPGNAWRALLERAERLARSRHAGQVDKGGAPYWRHPARVSAGCSAPEAKIAAWLHDLLEDTATTAEELRSLGFPETVVLAVELDTRRGGDDYMSYIRRIAAACGSADPVLARAAAIAREVKMSDLRDNMNLSRLPMVREADLRRMEKYRAAYRILESAVTGGTGAAGMAGMAGE